MEPHVVPDFYGNALHENGHAYGCAATFRGWRVTSAVIFKVGSETACANLRRLDDGSKAERHMYITFVREPMSRLVSGYSEIEWRTRETFQNYAAKYKACADCYTFMHQPEPRDGSSKRAAAFLHDLLHGCLKSPCCPETERDGDLHVSSQVSFLTSFLRDELNAGSKFALVGRLEHMSEDWAKIGKTIPGWPALDKSLKPPYSDKHLQSNAASGNIWRLGMEKLLAAPAPGSDPSPYRLAACRIYLPDYSCFGYPLPSDCAQAISSTEYLKSCPPELRAAMKMAS